MENIILDTTSKTLLIKLDVLPSTNQTFDITVSYVDNNGSTLTDGAQETQFTPSSGSTSATILGAPASGHVRNALTVTVVNNDIVPHTFYLYKVVSSTNYLVAEQYLVAGASWDSNLSVDNSFDLAGAIYNANADPNPSASSKIAFWEINLSALRSMTFSNLVSWLQTYFIPIVTSSPSGNVLTSNGSAWVSAAPSGGGGGGRTTLTANTTYYVSTTGNDSNNGLSSGAAFATIQHALNVVATLDCATYNVTISVADGTYTGAVTLPFMLGSGVFTLQGDMTTPANCIISTTSAACIATGYNSNWTVQGFKLQTATTGDCIIANTTSYLTINTIVFGAIASGYRHMYIGTGAKVLVNGNYTISGAGGAAHFIVEEGSLLQCIGHTITVSASLTFSTAFAVADNCGIAFYATSSFSLGANTVTAPRYAVYLNGVILSPIGGTSGFPGNVAGSTATGGQYQ